MADPEDDGEEAGDVEIELLPTETPTVDAANVKAVRQRGSRLERERLEAQAFWTRVFDDPVGRREMWGVLQACHTFETQFGVGPNGFPQAEASWFHAGEQSVGQRLWKSWLNFAKIGVIRMHEEYDPPLVKPQRPARTRKAPHG